MAAAECIERKIVSYREDGSRAEWWLMPYGEDYEQTVWRPVIIDPANDDILSHPAWLPFPGSQYLFLECPIFEALYHGNRGPGKTLTLLMDFAKEVGKGFGKAWRGILFRRQYGDLDDVAKKIEEWFPKIFGPKFRFLRSKSEYMAIWPTGEALLLRHLYDENDYNEYHGHEYPWIGFEELTQWPDDKAFRLMQSCCRGTIPGMPHRVRASTNPYGAGHCLPYGEVLTPDRGWVDIKAMKPGDGIVSVRPDGSAYTTAVSHVIGERYKGSMISRRGRGLHMEFTENHRLPLLNTDFSSHVVKPFYELPGQANIRRTAESWEGEPLESFSVPEVKTRRLKNAQPLTITGIQYAKLMGWYLSEGFTVKRDRAFAIAQSKSQGRADLWALFDEIGFVGSWSKTAITIYSPSWYEYFKQFGLCREKFAPDIIKRAEAPILRAFFNAAMAGDGCWHKPGVSGAYYTISKTLADDVAEIAVKLGFRVHVSQRERPGRIGLSYAVNVSPGKAVQLATGNHVYDVDTTMQTVNIERNDFDGKVYCLTVPESETFFVRQNGCVWLSGNSWVKKRYHLPDKSGQVIREPGELPRVSIRGNLNENFLLLHTSPEYLTLVKGSARNKAQQKAWVDGDWSITSGGMFDDIWSVEHHVLPTFPASVIPRGWLMHRAYDHGSSHPFSVGWWLESNGEPITYKGRTIGSKRGDIILWREWYGTSGNDNEGVRMTSRRIAIGIKDREADEGIWGRCDAGPADTEIFNKETDRNGHSPADDMEAVGVYFERADKSSGSRKRGWQLIRNFLENAIPKNGVREEPGLFVCDCCRYWLNLVPPTPRDEKDPDEIPDKYEDHSGDMTRYRLSWEPPVMFRVGFR